MPDWYVAQMVQGPGLPLGTVAHIFGVRLQRKEPLSRPFGTNPILFFIIIEKNKEGIRYKDPNGPEEKFVPAKPKSKALELVNGLKAYLAKVEAGEAGREIEGDRKHPARAKKAGKDGEKASKDGKKAGKNDEKAGEDEQAAADGSTAKGNGAAKAGSSKKRANERVGEPGASKKSKKKE